MKPITWTQILKLRLDRPPDEIREAAMVCRNGWNKAIEDWLLRQRGKPGTPKQTKTKADGKELAESTKLYHAIRDGAPELHTTAASMMAGQLSSHLSAKVDWRRKSDGKQPRRRDAILAYEDRPPWRTALQVPVHNQFLQFDFDDWSIILSGVLRGQSPWTIPLLSGNLTPGQKRLMRRAACGDIHLPCGTILERRDRWYLYLPLRLSREPLDNSVTAVLEPAHINLDKPIEYQRPFCLHVADHDRKWYIGDGRYLRSNIARIEMIKKEIGRRYSEGFGTGHGRRKVVAAQQKRSIQAANIRSEVRRRAIAMVVRRCEQAGAGHVLYREPTEPTRKRCWFAEAGVDWDWTRFRVDLGNKLAAAGIQMTVERLKYKDFCPEKPAKGGV